ncbi:unnamed protein product [Vitrella brassicaformis CCMP3155]|uniref:Dickkopf N-terminal cysteine-rich domain-containing protein n=1 Tax=Vitrella brassicaformis (strain CCMP3155) TaxID=1169540 RepID=A0A0G4F9M4_VITBC|nr:unnamed protein product [Vitrella brassicaformis CCMP3155]|eukprot:CEM09656.1 unnamed protein product [Vitrella brassicaformis CCMP3155]
MAAPTDAPGADNVTGPSNDTIPDLIIIPPVAPAPAVPDSFFESCPVSECRVRGSVGLPFCHIHVDGRYHFRQSCSLVHADGSLVVYTPQTLSFVDVSNDLETLLISPLLPPPFEQADSISNATNATVAPVPPPTDGGDGSSDDDDESLDGVCDECWLTPTALTKALPEGGYATLNGSLCRCRRYQPQKAGLGEFCDLSIQCAEGSCALPCDAYLTQIDCDAAPFGCVWDDATKTCGRRPFPSSDEAYTPGNITTSVMLPITRIPRPPELFSLPFDAPSYGCPCWGVQPCENQETMQCQAITSLGRCPSGTRLCAASEDRIVHAPAVSPRCMLMRKVHQPCKTDFDCDPLHSFCHPTFSCLHLGKEGERCLEDRECVHSLRCNMAEASDMDPEGRCRPLFGLRLGTPSSQPFLCVEGWLDTNGKCAQAARSKQVGRGCNNDDTQCLTSDPFGQKAECRCKSWWDPSAPGPIGGSSRYCHPLIGDYSDRAAKLKTWLEFRASRCGYAWSDAECAAFAGSDGPRLLFSLLCEEQQLSGGPYLPQPECDLPLDNPVATRTNAFYGRETDTELHDYCDLYAHAVRSGAEHSVPQMSIVHVVVVGVWLMRWLRRALAHAHG